MEIARAKAYHFLSHYHLATLSTISSDGRPWGSSVYVTADEHFNFFFISHVKSHKYHNLKANPHVALTITDDQSQQTVQAAGKASELSPESPEFGEAFRNLASVHAPGDDMWRPPVSKIDAGEAMIFRVTPDILQYSSFQSNRAPLAEIERII